MTSKSDLPYYSRFLFGSLSLAVVFAMAGPMAIPASAQYKSAKVKPEVLKKVKALRSQKSRVLNGSVDFAQGKPVLDRYYKEYVLKAITDIDTGVDLGALRIEMQKDLANARSKEARDYVLALFMAKTRQYADAGVLHPAARYNAILMLGDLNDQEATSGSNARPPVPSRKALGDLLRRFKSNKVPDVVRLGAVMGILRHAKLRTLSDSPAPLKTNERSVIGSAMIQFMTAAAPADRTAEVHDWMRRRAADVLGYLAIPGKDDAAVKALVSVVEDRNASLDLRCAAAEAMGRINYNGSSMKGAEVVQAIGELALDCCVAENDELWELFQKSQTRGGRGGEMGMESGPPRRRGGEGYGGDGFGGDDEEELYIADPRTLPSRRRLIHRLTIVRSALDGNKSRFVQGIAGNMPGADASDQVVDLVDAVIETSKDTETKLNTFGKKLLAHKQQLAEFVGDATPVSDAEAAAAG